MRVAYLVAGAGGMYCGSCLRDHRIVSTLRAQDRDVLLFPLYTPIKTDEQNVDAPEVHYGGVSLYLSHRSRLFRRLPGVAQRLLDLPAVLRWAARRSVRTDPGNLGSLSVAMLQRESHVHGHHLERLIDSLRRVEPAVVHLPNLMFLAIAAPIKEALGATVVCTLAGEDVFIDGLPDRDQQAVSRLIREHAGRVDAFIAPTQYYALAAAERFALDPERVHHVPMGVARHGTPQRPATDQGTLVIGYMARVAEEKGLAALAEALVELRAAGHDCCVRAAGYLADPDYLEHVMRIVSAGDCTPYFDYLGEVDLAGKTALLDGVDCLCVPATYPEAKGLYVLEAAAAGVPVVMPRRGALTELVEATGGGVLYDPARPRALCEAVVELMARADRGRQLGQAGRAAVHDRFSPEVMAAGVWSVFGKACQNHAQS